LRPFDDQRLDIQRQVLVENLDGFEAIWYILIEKETNEIWELPGNAVFDSV
jgi:hypothetical protein